MTVWTTVTGPGQVGQVGQTDEAATGTETTGAMLVATSAAEVGAAGVVGAAVVASSTGEAEDGVAEAVELEGAAVVASSTGEAGTDETEATTGTEVTAGLETGTTMWVVIGVCLAGHSVIYAAPQLVMTISLVLYSVTSSIGAEATGVATGPPVTCCWTCPSESSLRTVAAMAEPAVKATRAKA